MIALRTVAAKFPRRSAEAAAATLLLAVLAACQTTPPVGPPALPGTVSHLPPGNSQRDGPEANPPPNLEAVPDAVPQIEPVRVGGPNKPYEIGGQTYVPVTDDRALAEKGLASWYGKKFHGHRTASGEAYNMYAMTAAHKTLPIPSYARVRNPANGHEVIVRVNDRGPFTPGRIIDLSYTAALKLGVLGGVQAVEISRITADDIRSGAAFAHGPAPAAAAPEMSIEQAQALRKAGESLAITARGKSNARLLPPAPGDVVAISIDAGGAGKAVALVPVDLGAAAAADVTPIPTPATFVDSATAAAAAAPPASGAGFAASTRPDARPGTRPDARDERAHPETTAGSGYWLQLGAYKQRDGALEFQRRLIDEQPWLAPLLAVFSDHGLNKLQAGPYRTREDAKSAADRVRKSLELVPTIVDKR